MIMSVEGADCDDDDRGRDGGKRTNALDEDDDVLSIHAESDYELVAVSSKEKSNTSTSASRVESSESKKEIQNKGMSSTEKNTHSDVSKSGQSKRRFNLDGTRRRGRRSGVKRQREHERNSGNHYIANEMRRRGHEPCGTQNVTNFESRNFPRNMRAYSGPQAFPGQKRGILGDAPLGKGRVASMSQNQNPFFADDSYHMNKRYGMGAPSSLTGDRNNVQSGNETSWKGMPFPRSRESGRGGEGFGNPRMRSSILGDGALYQQRTQNYPTKNGANSYGKKHDSSEPLSTSREDHKSSIQCRTQDFGRQQRISDKRQRTAESGKHFHDNGKSGKFRTKSDSGSRRCPSPRNVNNSGPVEFERRISSKNDILDSPLVATHDIIERATKKTSEKSEIIAKQTVKEVVDNPAHLKTTDISGEESLPPTKKSRVTLLPTPDSHSLPEWSTKKEIASGDDGHAGVSGERSSVEFLNKSGQSSSNIDLSGCAKRTPEKTATVAPLRPVASTLQQPDSSLDDSEPPQINFLERMVTPPIEVTYAIDAPPRPPNPGPTHLTSSNSNSPAASRPSSRSGRYIIYEQNRAATPDVPPRPVNPPPPVSAPSPASTPEGMPPRPQNPGPPLDVTLSTMSRPQLTNNSSQPNHDRALSFADTSNPVPSLLPLPAHSKMPSHRRQPGLSAEPSPAHLSVARVGLLESPSLTDVGVSSSMSKSSSTTSFSSTSKAMKPLLALPDKVSDEKRIVLDQEKHIFIPNYTAMQRGNVQSVVMDLSKPSVTDANTSTSIISNNGQASKILHGESQLGNCLTSDKKDSVKDTEPSTAVSASLSFSTNVVSSSYPLQTSYFAPPVSSSSTRSALLPLPNIDNRKEETSIASSEDSVDKTSKPTDTSTVTQSETVLKENIITCLKNDQYAEGLGALKDAIAKMPDKFGDGEVYEVIEYFGQNDAFEHVVPAARLVRVPDEKLLQFLVHVTEQSPTSFKDKDEELWLIFNQVLSVNASPSAVDAFIKCFAAISSWNRIWAALPLYGNATKVPPSTIGLCIQSVASGQDDKHLRDGILFLKSLPHHVKCALNADIVNSLWLHCAEKGLTDAVNEVDQVKKLIPQTPENNLRLSSRLRTLIMELIVSGQLNSLLDLIGTVGQQYFQQYLDCFAAGFMVVEDPITKIGGFLKDIKGLAENRRLTSSRNHEVFSASLCVMVMRHLSQRQTWADAFELWRLAGELGINCERAAALENESQTSIALLCLEICVRHDKFETAVSMLSESLVLGQPWTDVNQVRRRICILQEIFYRTVETRLDYAAVAFRALLSTKDTDQAIIAEYGRLVDLMTVYNNYIVGACHSGDLDTLTTALELVSIAHNKHLIVKPTVLRYLVVACVRFKLHTSVKEFLQRGMTVSIYPTIDVHSNMLLLPTDLATEEIAALLLLYLMLLKEYLVQAMQVSKGDDDSVAGGVDVHQACSITVVPNNVNARDHEFTQRFQLASTEYGLLQRVQSILASGTGSSSSGREGLYNCPVDYLKSPISSELSFEGGRSVLKLNTTEVYNNVYYIEPPSD